MPCLKIEVGDEGGHVGILLEAGSLELPDLDEPVPAGEQKVAFSVDQRIDIVHGTVQEASMSFRSLGITCAASVPVAPVKFLNGVGVCVVLVDGVPCAWDMMFAVVSGVLHSVPVERIVVLGVIIVHSDRVVGLRPRTC